MATIVLSNHAKRDAEEIWRFVASRRPRHANKLIWRFDHVLRILSQHLRSGQERADLGLGMRVYPVRNFLVVYRRVPGGIEIARVIHSAIAASSAL